jgi:putative cardiolipin synthase
VTLATPAELAGLSYIGAPQSKLEWSDVENGERRTYNFDPQAGFYRNLLTGLFLLLPVQGQL